MAAFHHFKEDHPFGLSCSGPDSRIPPFQDGNPTVTNDTLKGICQKEQIKSDEQNQTTNLCFCGICQSRPIKSTTRHTIAKANSACVGTWPGSAVGIQAHFRPQATQKPFRVLEFARCWTQGRLTCRRQCRNNSELFRALRGTYAGIIRKKSTFPLFGNSAQSASLSLSCEF